MCEYCEGTIKDPIITTNNKWHDKTIDYIANTYLCRLGRGHRLLTLIHDADDERVTSQWGGYIDVNFCFNCGKDLRNKEE